MAILREERSLTRFERVAFVMSGGGALGAYQAGAYAAMETAGFHPDWVAGISVGALNAAIIGGNPPRERIPKLQEFWRRVGGLTKPAGEGRRPGLLQRLLRRRRQSASLLQAGAPVALAAQGGRTIVDIDKLRGLLAELVDFDRLNDGTVRVSLSAVHLASGAEICFDNDRQVLGPDHILASAALPPGLPPIWIEGEAYGSGIAATAPLETLLDLVPPADTLCFLLDCFDPEPGASRGTSRARQQITAYRRRHSLRRVISILGEKLVGEIHADPEIRSCLALGCDATMNLVHLVHESSPIDLAGKLTDFSAATMARRWKAGERDMAASLGRPAWLAPPPRRVGVVVHEMRGGVAALLT